MKKNNSRAVGNTYERQIRKEFIDLGYDNCQTTRYASKEKDNKGLDLVNVGIFNIQIKRWKSAPSYQDILKSMPQDGNWNIIIHKKPNKGEVAVMDKKTFYDFIKLLRQYVKEL